MEEYRFVSFPEESRTKREHKGKSLTVSTDDFTAVDIETTGLLPCYDDIIEVAAIRYRGGVKVAEYVQLVNPGYEIDEFIVDLTGITNEMLDGQPKVEEVLPEFLSFLGDDIIVGHNVNFDVNFIYDVCERLEIEPLANDFIDTMRLSRRIYPAWKNHKLKTVIKELGLSADDLHRAGNDAEIAASAYIIMRDLPDYAEVMKPAKNLRAKDIVAHEGLVNEESPFYGKVCVFTGVLEHFVRKDAMQIITDIGGICEDRITAKTNFLILGNNDYCKSIKDGKSSKQKKAEKIILEGGDLQIIPETVFLDMLSDD